MLFSVKAYHLKWQELPLDPNIKKWSVHVLNLDRQKRHLDRATLNMFWEILDRCVLVVILVLPSTLLLFNCMKKVDLLKKWSELETIMIV